MSDATAHDDAAPLPLIEAEGVSKKFAMRFADSRRYGIRDFGRISLGLPRRTELRQGEFWALQDVSFQVHQGESLAILGRNGAGKSTLLTLMTGRMLPDAGRLTIRGRVGVLALGNFGFRPGLSGRDNIYLKGIALGIARRELEALLPDIVAFAELGDFIDAPLRTYSAGMVARLGFAIAINVQPDILLADEALSAGDAGFAEKCAQRVSALREHMTLVIVTHSPAFAVKLCARAIVLHQGKVVFAGETPAATDYYLEKVANAPQTAPSVA
ncbi:MAG: ABC transporter ATP-binding protein [Kiritimatiellae bacterium]|nr:ABC transporter ATP-binding protein [Kiritimatiellia bacterium]